MLKIVLYWAVCVVEGIKPLPNLQQFYYNFFFFRFQFNFFFPFCLKDLNILLNCSNYRPKFNFIDIQKIQFPKFFLKVNKYKILNYYINFFLGQGGPGTTLDHKAVPPLTLHCLDFSCFRVVVFNSISFICMTKDSKRKKHDSGQSQIHIYIYIYIIYPITHIPKIKPAQFSFHDSHV